MRPVSSALLALLVLAVAASASEPSAPGGNGYYRDPAIFGDTIVFSSEGDLWKVPVAGGHAARLTTHPSEELSPSFSPDGRSIAFIASYEGPQDLYTMPVEGGLPERRTWGESVRWAGWTPDAKLLYTTSVHSTLPNAQLVLLDPTDGSRRPVELSEASEGTYLGKTLYFTRMPFQGSHTKRYKGGTAQNIWRYDGGDHEALALTADYPGTSKCPMACGERLYFLSDRDGTVNLWSMAKDGSDLRQHTRHEGFDIRGAAASETRIVYQLAGDIWLYDIGAGISSRVAIDIDSDFDQEREHWIAKPMDFLTASHPSPKGDRVALTARGEVFVAPQHADQGRLVQVTRAPGVRYREARFLPDGKSLVALSDESGEVEFWKLPADGVGKPVQLTSDGDVLRWGGEVSPDGKLIAHTDKNLRLWLLEVDSRKNTKVDESPYDDFSGISWSPDSRWFAYVAGVANTCQVIRLCRVGDRKLFTITSDRQFSYAPDWSVDGKWLYFLTDRNLKSLVYSPWGSRQPEPYFDRQTEIYALSLKKGERFPFAPVDELHPDEDKGKDKDSKDAKGGKKDKKEKKGEKEKGEESEKVADVEIDLEGLSERQYRVPVPAGNYSALWVTEGRLYWTEEESGADPKRNLASAPIARRDVEVKKFLGDVRRVELTSDRKTFLVQKEKGMYLVEAGEKAPEELDKKALDLSAWKFSMKPREEWQQMFVDAWRLERDYFYDPKMHGVDWPAMREKYRPMVDRVRTRGELSDVISQMVSELSALHTYVYGGDARSGPDDIPVAQLGAEVERAAGGWRVTRIFRNDPDDPEGASPLARPEVAMHEGDLIEEIDGLATRDLTDPGVALRNKAGRQVLLKVNDRDGGKSRQVVIVPIDGNRAKDLRYDDWEYTRRLVVETKGGGDIGYVHLRAMGSGDIAQWVRDYFPVYNRKALIIDVRHNGGGNIDSWILGRLLRRAWMYWSSRVGQPYWNMQLAFRGHLVVLCDERTGSDGEVFADGFRRLGLGKVIGKRTWGGEIWLSQQNFLRDKGIATAGENGVYGPDGQWLIEGHGVDPDIVVDNPPHATFKGGDAQLDAAIDHLRTLIRDQPIVVPAPPSRPDKSFKNGVRNQ